MQTSALCRSRRELSNAHLLAKIGVDTAENEPLEVWGKIQFTIHFTPQAGSEATTTTRDTDAHTHSPSKGPRRTSFVALRKTFGRQDTSGKKSVFKEYEEIKGRPTLKFANYTVPGLQISLITGSKFQSFNSNSRELELTNLLGLVLGCIEAKFCK